jgi:AcrR family transcriptional regulator
LHDLVMASSPSRERLIQAASELFLSQGVSHTTTRQIANLAGVNEVTLFRNFGNKYGLLRAVIEEAPTFRNLGETLMQQTSPTSDRHQTLRNYASECLHALEESPAFVRSLIGEAGQYPEENRQALGQRLDEASHYVAQYLEQTMPSSPLPPIKLAGFLGALLMGYAVIESASTDHHLWEDREDFLAGLVELLLKEAVPAFEGETQPLLTSDGMTVQDLPDPWVHEILRAAKAASTQEYAIAYVLFGAGLEPQELVGLERSQHFNDKSQHTLQVGLRQVPVNQWICGKRYGSFLNNPLTKWLKSRKDDDPLIFIKEPGLPLTGEDIHQKWTNWTVESHASAHAPTPLQAKQTWCVEMLARGMSLEHLSILSGWSTQHLAPYVVRAQAKAALEQARLLDQKQV